MDNISIICNSESACFTSYSAVDILQKNVFERNFICSILISQSHTIFQPSLGYLGSPYSAK